MREAFSSDRRGGTDDRGKPVIRAGAVIVGDLVDVKDVFIVLGGKIALRLGGDLALVVVDDACAGEAANRCRQPVGLAGRPAEGVAGELRRSEERRVGKEGRYRG